MRAHAGEQREGAVLELHHHALQRLLRLFVGNLEQLQDDRLVLAEHLARCDAKEQGVADLAGSAGDRDAGGDFMMLSPGEWEDDPAARGAAEAATGSSKFMALGGRRATEIGAAIPSACEVKSAALQ